MNTKKYNNEDFMKCIKENNLTILEGEYKNCRSKFLVMSDDGYKGMVTPYNFIQGMEIRFFHPNNEFALSNISLWIINNNLDFKLLSTEYKKATDNLILECPTHGIFEKTFNLIRKNQKKNGSICPSCSICSKYNIEEINTKLKNIGFVWIAGEYKDATSKIQIIDNIGYKSEISLVQIMQGAKPTIFDNTNRFTLENIELWLQKNKPNLKLLSEKYSGSRVGLKLFCKKHNHHFKKSWTSLISREADCPKCKGSYIYTLDEIKDMLKEINDNIEILYEYQKNSYRTLRCFCKIHMHEWDSNFSDLITKKCGCNICGYEKLCGENNWNYNHDKTQEEREIKREYPEYYQWRRDVFERDNYTCIITGDNRGGNLVAHHLNSYTKYKDLRTDVNNGVTITEDIHLEFHTIYGYKNNTAEQFCEFYKMKTGKDFKLREVS